MERIEPVGPLPGSIPRIDRAPAADRVGERNPGKQPHEESPRKRSDEDEEDGEPHIDVSA
ncbi:MAG: hypothetical protein ABSG64_13495 [Solirubrobacteraceae bacterium]|jgi:hypothetical protein